MIIHGTSSVPIPAAAASNERITVTGAENVSPSGSYRIVTIAVDGRIMYVYADGTLIKTLGRDTTKPIPQTRAHRVTRRTKDPAAA